MSTSPLNLDFKEAAEPIIRLTLTIIKDAIRLKADAILLELDLETHLTTHKSRGLIIEKYKRPSFFEAIFKKRFKDFYRFGESTVEKMFFELGRLPNALKVTFIIRGVEKNMPSANGGLFEDITQVLLVAAGVPAKTNGEVSAVIETVKPVSKWRLESKDLTRQIHLCRIRAT